MNPDGKTATHGIKGRKVISQLVRLGGETVLSKLPKVSHMPEVFEDRLETGAWLGSTVRSGEHIVGTEKRVAPALPNLSTCAH